MDSSRLNLMKHAVHCATFIGALLITSYCIAEKSGPALNEPAVDWSKNNGNGIPIKQAFDRYKLNRKSAHSQYSYNGNGSLGIPSLTINQLIEYKTMRGSAAHEPQGAGIDLKGRHIVPNVVGLASKACLFLDLELTGRLGAWGPECKITQFLQMPAQGMLVKRISPVADDGAFYYTPKNPETHDVLRFILENGEGKKVDVIVNINIGGDDTDYS
jgi:hypothetical protein